MNWETEDMTFVQAASVTPWASFAKCGLVVSLALTCLVSRLGSAEAAQTDGPNWIWWEGEDAVEHTFPERGYFAPTNDQEKGKLSEGDWLQHHQGAGLTAKWEVEVPDGGTFAFWTRKFWKHGPFNPYIDRQKKMVHSATGELIWSWGRGAVALDATHAQGACGFLGELPNVNLKDVTIRSGNEYGAVLVVSLDSEPLATSAQILLQVMTEDRNYGWETEEMADGETKKKITNLGSPPIVVKNISGTVSLKRRDAAGLRVTALDFNGYQRQEIGDATRIELLKDCLYYLISK
jgi:hypothetical protein